MTPADRRGPKSRIAGLAALLVRYCPAPTTSHCLAQTDVSQEQIVECNTILSRQGARYRGS